MDQLGIVKLAAAHLQEFAFGLIIVICVAGGLGYRSLANCLKRYDTSTWEDVGRPELFSKKSIKDELSFSWYILARKYRKSEIRRIRVLGDLCFVCFVAVWLVALTVMIFGDLGKYDLHLRFGN
ncbi:hypothetical protein [Bradyrhizobium sp. McL0615]|uniref:hypothetical protein n=1 Tax=Bradyrhizobium sp. McL0615 TaxID=3415673 RepID=UPI003CEC8F71